MAFRVVTPPGAEPAQGRVVAYGNAEFANNFFIEFLGNKDLFVNTIAWLAHEPQSIAHRPEQQELGVSQFFVSAEDEAQQVQLALFATIGVALVLRQRWG